MVPSPCAFAKNQFTPPDTFSPNSRLTSSGTSRDRNDPATSSAASATPCSRAVSLPPSRTSGAPPCSATRSLSADSNSTSEPSSSVNRTNSAITHPQGPHQGRRQTVTHILPHPRPIHDPTPVTGAATKRGRTPRPPGWFHRGPHRRRAVRRSDNGPLSRTSPVVYALLLPGDRSKGYRVHRGSEAPAVYVMANEDATLSALAATRADAVRVSADAPSIPVAECVSKFPKGTACCQRFRSSAAPLARPGGLFTKRLLCLLSYTGGRLCAWWPICYLVAETGRSPAESHIAGVARVRLAGSCLPGWHW